MHPDERARIPPNPGSGQTGRLGFGDDTIPLPLDYARRDPTPFAFQIWCALGLGMLAITPFLIWQAMDLAIISPFALWFNARNQLLYFGAMGLGPTIGVLAVLLARPPRSAGIVVQYAKWGARLLGVSSSAVGLIVSSMAWFGLLFFIWNLCVIAIGICIWLALRRNEQEF